MLQIYTSKNSLCIAVFLLKDNAAVVPSHEVFHRYEVRRGARARQKTMRQAIAHFDVEDIVVHREHGIARYLGLKVLKGRGEIEYLTLEFASNRLLHVPATHANLVQRYVGAFKGKPELSALGGTKMVESENKSQGCSERFSERNDSRASSARACSRDCIS